VEKRLGRTQSRIEFNRGRDLKSLEEVAKVGHREMARHREGTDEKVARALEVFHCIRHTACQSSPGRGEAKQERENSSAVR